MFEADDGLRASARGGNLRAMSELLVLFNSAREWGQFHNARNLAMALSVESSELLSHYLWCSDDGEMHFSGSKRVAVCDEVADVLICLLNFCEATGIDLGEEFLRKLRINEEHYPVEMSRGKALKYDELRCHGDGSGV